MSPIAPRPHTHRRRLARVIVMALLALTVLAVAVLWGWNTVLHGLFAWPEVKFTQALATVVGVAALAASVGAALQWGSRIAAPVPVRRETTP